jgi:hypothetical protein
MPIGALIGAGTSIIGGIMQKKAANKAADLQAKSAEQARQDVLKAGDQAATGVTDAANQGRADIMASRDLLNPYTTAGSTAAGQVTDMTQAPQAQFSFDPSKIGMDPGYQFRIDQANKALRQNGAALGNIQSGGFAKALSDYNQNMAGAETQQAFQRQVDTFNTNRSSTNDRINQLLSVMGLGQNAAGAQMGATQSAAGVGLQGAGMAGQFRTGAAQSAGDYLTGAGQARADAAINNGNTNAGMLGAVGNVAQSANWRNIFNRPAVGRSMASLPLYSGMPGVR